MKAGDRRLQTGDKTDGLGACSIGVEFCPQCFRRRPVVQMRRCRQMPHDRWTGRRMIDPPLCATQPGLKLWRILTDVMQEARKARSFTKPNTLSEPLGQLGRIYQMLK